MHLKLSNFAICLPCFNADYHLIVFSRHAQLLALHSRLECVIMNEMYQDKHEHFIFFYE